MIKTSAFHDYDIRGIYPTEIDEDFYYKLGRALAVFAGEGKQALIGRDMRLSSKKLHDSLLKGLIEGGINTTSLGLSSTEMFYFEAGRGKYDIGIIVSASHNPPQYNGAKIMRDGTIPIHKSSGLQQLRKIMEEDKYPQISKAGSFSKIDIFDQWISHALSFVDHGKLKQIKVVVDAGNGMGGPSWLAIEDKIAPVQIIPLFCDPDGRFPNHLADPLKPQNLIMAKQALLKHKADLAVVLDGDADRMFLIDENGKKLSGTVTTALIADYLLAIKKGPILYSVTCGQIIKQVAKKHSVEAIKTRVGHSFIKEKMRQTKGLFAGEHSGHLYFQDNNYAESSLIAALYVFELISKSGKKLSEIASDYDIYEQSGEMNFVVKNSSEILTKIKEKYSTADYNIEELDGLTVNHQDFWFNVRASNTEPLLRVNIEANNRQVLEKINHEIVDFLISLGADKK